MSKFELSILNDEEEKLVLGAISEMGDYQSNDRIIISPFSGAKDQKQRLLSFFKDPMFQPFFRDKDDRVFEEIEKLKKTQKKVEL